MPEQKRRILHALKIDEISGVDNPAQVGARVAILKRAEPDGIPARKGAGDLVDALTSVDDEHQHGVSIERYDDKTYFHVGSAKAPDEEYGHSHALARTVDGYMLATVDGHTHTVDSDSLAQGLMNAMSKEGDPVMGDQDTDTDKTTDPNPELQAQLDRANAVLGLDADERAHFDGLGEAAEQTEFLAKSPDIRKAEIAAARKAETDADPVVYKTRDGMELRKSAGAVMISMAKRLDASEKRSAELETDRTQARLEKRAETELPHMAGDVKSRAALLKSVEAIPDATQRAAVLESLKSQNEAMAFAFKKFGTGEGVETGSPDDELDKMAKRYAEEHNVTHAAAVSKVLQTPKGAELYDKSVS